MMKKLMLTAAFAGVVMFLVSGCHGFGKDCCDSCKKCNDKAACPMKTECEKPVTAPAK